MSHTDHFDPHTDHSLDPCGNQNDPCGDSTLDNPHTDQSDPYPCGDQIFLQCTVITCFKFVKNAIYR